MGSEHTTRLTRTLNRSGFAVLLAWLLTACASVPLDVPRTPSTALTDTEHTRLGIDSTEWRQASPELNGFYPLTQGKDAFGARLVLMDVAETSIDAQYFLMKPDDAGLVFSSKLLHAAERGVRVRFLLDDIFTTADDVDLALLSRHPNVELRIFNPISRKGIYAFNYAGNFKLANRRMHNKSLTVDNQVSIVGGRNIAAEYFQLETSGEFFDFDMMAAGPIVQEISASFDDYWNHPLAIPFEALNSQQENAEMEKRSSSAKERLAQSGDSIYADAINGEVMRLLINGEAEPFLANARMIVDSPDKLLKEISRENKVVINEIGAVLNQAEREILFFTPYFIPGKAGVEFLRDLVNRGVHVVVVTNSLGTNNHTAVHSAYSRYRKDILEAGIELWEARADAAKITAPDGSTQLEKMTLHTKGILIDRERLFVGSLNLDPRSTDINTEMGLLIDSKEMVTQATENVKRKIPQMAYRLELDDNRNIIWKATIDGTEVIETNEPQTSAWRRFQSWFLKIAPENQL